jgi:hypothetical protein
VDDALEAYLTGRADGAVPSRDAAKAEHPQTGADYRIGFLDGRIEVFAMLARARKFLEGPQD